MREKEIKEISDKYTYAITEAIRSGLSSIAAQCILSIQNMTSDLIKKQNQFLVGLETERDTLKERIKNLENTISSLECTAKSQQKQQDQVA